MFIQGFTSMCSSFIAFTFVHLMGRVTIPFPGIKVFKILGCETWALGASSAQ